MCDTADKLGVAPRTIEQKIQIAKNVTPGAKRIIRDNGVKIPKNDALKLSRLAPAQQEEAASQLAAGAIKSLDQYQPTPANLEAVTLEPEELQGVGQVEPVSAPLTSASVPPASEGHYATIKDSVDDLKNPDKDRSHTPDTFLMSFLFFLQKFRQGIANYATPEYTAVFPALTLEQLDQLQQEVNSACTALHNLFHKMERKSQRCVTARKSTPPTGGIPGRLCSLA